MDNIADVQDVNMYSDCSELPIWNFYKIGQTSDYSWLCIERNGIVPVRAKLKWKEVFNEYCELVGDSESQQHLRDVAELEELKQKYVMCSLLLTDMYSGMDKDTEKLYFRELAAWGFAFNQGKLMTEVKRANVWLKSIKTRMNLLGADVANYKKKSTKAERLEKQQVKLERITGRNNIDLQTTSVAKWVEIIKDSEELARQKRKNKAA